ncbi:MAG: hypothetical protein AAGM22_16825 [Acidobacteriota bacterium]
MSKKILLAGAFVALLLPPFVFVSAAWQAGFDAGAMFSALGAQYAAPRTNLGVVSGLGLLPIILLSLGVWLVGRLAGGDKRPAFAVAGLVPILIVIGWSQFEYWPHFFPERRPPGFPHGLELVIGPLIFAPAAMAVGLLTAWFALAVKRPTP